MRNFLRTLKYSLPYRWRLLASVLCAVMVAILWSLNLSAIYPVLKILGSDKNLHEWVDEEYETAEKLWKENERRLERHNAELEIASRIPDDADREDAVRKSRWEIAKVESD